MAASRSVGVGVRSCAQVRDVVLHAEQGVVQLPQCRRHPSARAAVADPTPALARAAAVLVDSAAVRQQEQLERGDLSEWPAPRVSSRKEAAKGMPCPAASPPPAFFVPPRHV